MSRDLRMDKCLYFPFCSWEKYVYGLKLKVIDCYTFSNTKKAKPKPYTRVKKIKTVKKCEKNQFFHLGEKFCGKIFTGVFFF